MWQSAKNAVVFALSGVGLGLTAKAMGQALVGDRSNEASAQQYDVELTAVLIPQAAAAPRG